MVLVDTDDALVAQTALDLMAPLVTFNQKHYACVPGLEVVAPYSRSIES